MLESVRELIVQFKTETCRRCNGTGRNGRGDWCWPCAGTGKVRRKDQR